MPVLMALFQRMNQGEALHKLFIRNEKEKSRPFSIILVGDPIGMEAVGEDKT
jgi:hypothetical protein